ncbi:hemagglutinin repeat-containing protein [Glaciimonas immobilis]|uniref:Uncharacterized protein n=1 Tax=Glaciimonas immobilis TaxID=728004 RepID=A0A840RN58_9BURK|nr:hemagglutinin repeat-containing protein [Glaciimonas immobilis]KAF3999097.1 hypothetical protein HAV38_03900 [Glaciimonas immobilis]MBB5198532.1 hypothetical protein [Glaciimonas immobilis]
MQVIMQDVGIYAGRNINVLAAANTDTVHTDSHQSGTSIGILGGVNGRFTNFSKTNAAQNTDGTATSHSTSLISANAGNLNLQAGLDAQYNGTGQSQQNSSNRATQSLCGKIVGELASCRFRHSSST